MPLVNIHLMQGKPVEWRRKVGEIVYRTMMETINVPPKDNFQIITEHDRDSLVYDPEYLGIPRTDGIVVIQITLNEGRTSACRAGHPDGRCLYQPGRSEERKLVVWEWDSAIRRVTHFGYMTVKRLQIG